MASSDSKASLLFRNAPRGLDRKWIRDYAKRLSSTVAPGRSFTVLITVDKELQRLNHEFLGRDYPTDVLSFPMESEPLDVGEMAISAQRARLQAKEFRHTVEQEIAVLMLHGLLHLLGMDHEIDGGKMRRAEVKWRKVLDQPAGLIERVAK